MLHDSTRIRMYLSFHCVFDKIARKHLQCQLCTICFLTIQLRGKTTINFRNKYWNKTGLALYNSRIIFIKVHRHFKAAAVISFTSGVLRSSQFHGISFLVGVHRIALLDKRVIFQATNIYTTLQSIEFFIFKIISMYYFRKRLFRNSIFTS